MSHQIIDDKAVVAAHLNLKGPKMSYKILDDPTIPSALKALDAAAVVREYEARAAAEEEKRKARIKHAAEVQAAVAQYEEDALKKREEAEAKAARERERDDALIVANKERLYRSGRYQI